MSSFFVERSLYSAHYKKPLCKSFGSRAGQSGIAGGINTSVVLTFPPHHSENKKHNKTQNKYVRPLNFIPDILGPGHNTTFSSRADVFHSRAPRVGKAPIDSKTLY